MTRDRRLVAIKFINDFERANAHKLGELKTRRFRDKKFVAIPQKWALFRYKFLMNLDGVDFGAIIDEYGGIIEIYNRETRETSDIRSIGEFSQLLVDNEILKVVRVVVDALE